MNKKRLQRKLNQLLEIYNADSKKSIDLLRKINKLQTELNLPLTQKEKTMKKEEVKLEFYDKLKQDENKRKYNTAKKKKMEKFSFRNISREEAESVFTESLTDKEKEYVNRYNDWYHTKIKEIQSGIIEKRKNKKYFKVITGELLILLNEGMSSVDAASHFGVDRATITRHKLDNFKHEYKTFENKTYKTRGKDWNGLDAELLCEYLNHGRTVTEISEAHGISQAHLSQFKNKMIYKVYSLKWFTFAVMLVIIDAYNDKKEVFSLGILEVGRIVKHQGKRKRIIERFANYGFSSFDEAEYFYNLKCMETGLEINAKSDDIELILKKEPKFKTGEKVLVNYGLLQGKECEILKDGKLFYDDFDYELIVLGDTEPVDIYLVKEDYIETPKEKKQTFRYSLGDIIKCEKNDMICTVVNTSKAVRDRYKVEFYNGYTMWLYGYEMSLVGSNVTAKDDKVELSREDYFSILSLAVDLGNKDLLDTYKEKVNGI